MSTYDAEENTYPHLKIYTLDVFPDLDADGFPYWVIDESDYAKIAREYCKDRPRKKLPRVFSKPGDTNYNPAFMWGAHDAGRHGGSYLYDAELKRAKKAFSGFFKSYPLINGGK